MRQGIARQSQAVFDYSLAACLARCASISTSFDSSSVTISTVFGVTLRQRSGVLRATPARRHSSVRLVPAALARVSIASIRASNSVLKLMVPECSYFQCRRDGFSAIAPAYRECWRHRCKSGEDALRRQVVIEQNCAINTPAGTT